MPTLRLALIVLAIVLLTIVIRLPSLVHPRPIDDESVYAVVANEIVEGGRPYVDAIERKPPLLFWTYAAAIAIAGEYDWAGLHALALVWVIATSAGIYVLGRRLFDEEAGLAAAMLYAAFHSWGPGNDLAWNGELLMNLPIVWGWAIAVRCDRRPTRPALFAAGALIGTAFLLKQPAAVAAVPIGAYLLLARRQEDGALAGSIGRALVFSAGFGAAIAAAAGVLARQGILRQAYYWTVTNHDLPHVFWTRGALHTLAFVAACGPIVVGAALALADGTLWRGRRAERATLAGFVVASVVGCAAGGRFYPHYYIQLVPPLAILAGTRFTSWARSVAASRVTALRVAAAWTAVSIVVFGVLQWRDLRLDAGPGEAAVYVRRHSTRTDRVFVWGLDCDIYLDAQRRPASRWVLTAPLTGYIYGEALPGVDTRSRIVPGAWDQFSEDIARHPPRFIVDKHDDTNLPYPIENFPVLAALVRDWYVPAATVRDAVIYRRRFQ